MRQKTGIFGWGDSIAQDLQGTCDQHRQLVAAWRPGLCDRRSGRADRSDQHKRFGCRCALLVNATGNDRAAIAIAIGQSTNASFLAAVLNNSSIASSQGLSDQISS